ncbi:MAG TPA: serine hydrolase, partial [Phycisphaerae bacterium]|nr:serine hydrolase [Phycisphaerae bacterium]
MVFPDKDWTEASPKSQGLDAARLAEAMAVIGEIAGPQGNSQSLAVRNGYLIWKGPNIDELHPVWSCSKSYCSAALGLLIDDGKITLDTPLSDILPDMKRHYDGVTVRTFASFQAGYERGPHNPLDAAPPAFKPGEYFRYDWSPDKLAHALTVVAGEPLRELFRRRIADPIGMDPRQWTWGDWGTWDGLPVNGGSGSVPGGVSITARQMARFGHLLLNQGRWDGKQLLSAEYVAEATRPQTPASLPPFDPEGWYVKLPGAYGLLFWVNGVCPTGQRRWPNAPAGVFVVQGNFNNFCFVIPEWNMIL